ncbi:EH signature domain-containing protein [Paraglaciecola sp. Hal342]
MNYYRKLATRAWQVAATIRPILLDMLHWRILIDRAPKQGVDESWQNAVIAIAGDPRVPKSHPRYMKWWSQLTNAQSKKVQGWLSKLDLKLFLEALEDYSKSSRDDDMIRMFPSRKHFLEGMHKRWHNSAH